MIIHVSAFCIFISQPYSLHSAWFCHSKGCTFSLTHRWIGCTASIKASLLGLRIIWAQTTKANATVSVSTVSGFWRIGTVIWRTPHISHKQMKAWRFKVRLISLSELQPEYSEYWERCTPPTGPPRRLSPPSFCQRGGKRLPRRSSMFINIHSFIVRHGSWNLAYYCWMDDPGIHFVAMRLSAIEI